MILHNTQHDGFTLVELILVIVLLGILSATALPKFFNRSGFDQRVLFDDTLGALRYAQKLAVATGCQTVFSVASNQYQLRQGVTCNTAPFTTPVINPSKGGNYTGALNGITITATHASTRFNALGEADANNTISVGTHQISVIAKTGFSYDSTP